MPGSILGTRVLRTDTGWDELQAAWRDAIAADARGEHAGMLGAVACARAALIFCGCMT